MKIHSALLIFAGAALLPLFVSSLPAQEPGYDPVYLLNIPRGASWDSTAVTYAVDNSGLIASGSFDRVSYELILGGSTNPNSPNGYVYVSFPTFSPNASDLGVPNNVAYNAPIQQLLTGLNIYSNVPGIVTGTGINTGNIEFWNSNYDPGNSLPVPGANGGNFDFGDHPDPGGYGSMQIHNYGAGQTLFAYNNWGSNAGGSSDLGIGNNTGNSGQPDYTFQGNAGDYVLRELIVSVRPIPEPASCVLLGLGAVGLFAVARRRRAT